MFKAIFAILLSLTLFSCQENRPDQDKERIDNVCEKFMQTFRDGKIPEALHLLKKNTVMPSATIDTLQVTVINQINNITPSYGKMLAYEFISEHKIKDFIAKRFYILKFEKYYLKFDFTLYNNSKGWTIASFNYNEDLIELLY